MVEFAVVFVRASQDWQEEKMPIDISAVSWPFVGLMMLLAFVSALPHRLQEPICWCDHRLRLVRRRLHRLELLSARFRSSSHEGCRIDGSAERCLG